VDINIDIITSTSKSRLRRCPRYFNNIPDGVYELRESPWIKDEAIGIRLGGIVYFNKNTFQRINSTDDFESLMRSLTLINAGELKPDLSDRFVTVNPKLCLSTTTQVEMRYK